MRNSCMPIPWTHRDSRPCSQAEQDEEESFNAHHRLKIDPRQKSDLAHRLEHYQEMLTRMVEDPEFRNAILYETESYWDRKARERSERAAAKATRMGVYKKSAVRDEERRQEARRRHEQIHGKAPPPRPFYNHLDKAVQWQEKEDWNEWFGSYQMRPEPKPEPKLPDLGEIDVKPLPENLMVSRPEYLNHINQLMREWGVETEIAFNAHRTRLIKHALHRMGKL